jgi:type IV pilus assembly protein PilC
MPKFSYLATSFQGERKSGILEAKDEKNLAKLLYQEGYFLISADLIKEERRGKLEFSFSFLRGVSLVEKMFFTRNLKIMVSSGITLPRALRTLSLQTKNRKLAKTLLSLADEITKGKTLSESLALYPDIFPELFQNMIRVGEESGTLEKVLEVLTRQMEKEHELRGKIKGALIYPSVIVIAMIAIGILMLVVVVPKLAQTFQELEIELPLTTRLVISFGNFLVTKWYLLILIVLFSFLFFSLSLRTKSGRKITHFLLLKFPIISPIIKKSNAAYIVRTLSSLFSAGVPIVRSLEIISDTISNFYFRETIVQAAKVVKKGGKFSSALASYPHIYPPSVVQMIEVGEETGETSLILAKLADFFEEEVENATKNLSVIIEPLLMLMIGAAVGFFAVSMIQPIYSMLGAIKQ